MLEKEPLLNSLKSISLKSEVQVMVKITYVDTYQTTRESITVNNC